MFGSYLTSMVVDGVLRLVQVVTYRNGERTLRVLDKDGMPERILKG